MDGYRLDMGLRWDGGPRVARWRRSSAEQWQPAVTAMDIAGRADIALVSMPADAQLAGPVGGLREIGGGAEKVPSAGRRKG